MQVASMRIKAFAGASAIGVLMSSMALAQTSPTTPPASAAPTATTAESPPLSGANSFTAAQVTERLASAGYSAIADLKKDDRGIWRGKATKGDKAVNIAFDFKGNIVESQ